VTTRAHVRLALALAAAAAALSACGDEPSTTVIDERVVQRRDVERLAAGSPERAAMEFARFVQWEDPVAARSLLTARWDMSVSDIADSLRTAGVAARALSVPRLTGSRTHGARARVTAKIGPEDARLDLVRRHGRWRIDRLRIATIDMPRDGRRSR
jgi:hypothetical protein